MTSDHLPDIPDALRGFAPADDAGNAQARIGLMVTMYVMGGATGALRDTLQKLALEFDSAAGDELRWIAQSATGRWRRVSKGSRPLPAIAAGLASIPDGSEWGVAMHCGETMDSASDLAFAIYVPWGWKLERLHAASYVTAHFPLEWFVTRNETFSDVVMRWASLLQPIHGYAGFGLNLSVDARVARGVLPIAMPMALRAPGLELDIPVHHTIAAHLGIKGVNWLTILSHDWLAKAGGRSALHADLGPTFTLRDYTGGTVIQAGDAPQIGDLNRGLTPETYRALAMRLAALREPFYNAATSHSMREWLTRFDRMDAAASL